VVRGGGWQSGDKETFGFLAAHLADEGFAAAIELGYDMVRNRLLGRIKADLDSFHSRSPAFAAGAANTAIAAPDAAQ